MRSTSMFKHLFALIALTLTGLAQQQPVYAANGQCVWEGGPGKDGGFDSCAAEDCEADGGFALCSTAAGAPPSGYAESDLGPNKWLYTGCDHQSPHMANNALWCTSAGGTWNGSQQGCSGLPDGVFAGGSAADKFGPVVNAAKAFAQSKLGSSCTIDTTEGDWDANIPPNNYCWSGPPIYSLGIKVFSLKKNTYQAQGPGCSGSLTISFLMNRGAQCPTGYHGRNAVTGPQCVKEQCPDCYTMGNPTSPISGAKRHSETDYNPGSDIGLEFVRYYDSTGFYRPLRMTAQGTADINNIFPMDYWSHTYDRRLYPVLYNNPHVAMISRRHTGAIRLFDADGNEKGNVNGAPAKLVTLASGGWDLVLPDSSVERYNLAGYLVSITTRTGRVTSITHNGGLTTVVGPFGHTLVLAFDATELLQTATLPGGEIISYGYDSWMRLDKVERLGRAKRTYQYNVFRKNFLLSQIADGGVVFANYDYDSIARVKSSEHAGGADRHSFVYGTNSTTVSDPSGGVTVLTFSSTGGVKRIASVSQPCAECGGIANYSYDSKGNPNALTDFNGVQTLLIFDLARSLETWRTEAAGTPEQRVITTQWHPNFRVPTEINEPGRRTNLTYDSSGNPLTLAVTDTAANASRAWTFTYDNYGHVLTADNPRTDVSDLTTYTYYTCATGNECGQLHTETNALGHVTTYLTYDAHGNPLTVQDPNGLVTTFAYDQLQRLVSAMEGNEATLVEYWPNGMLKKVTQPDGSFLSYTYDDAQRLTGVTDDQGSRIALTLNIAGDVTRQDVFDAANNLVRTSSSTFNALGLQATEVSAQGHTTSFEYDPMKRLKRVQDPLFRDSIFGYDSLGRETSLTDPTGKVTQLSYDVRDELATVVDPRLLQTAFTTNAFGEVTQLNSPDTGISTSEYEDDGRLAEATDSRGRSAEYAYDALDRITHEILGDQSIVATWDAGANGKGRISQLSNNSSTLTWAYDAHGNVANSTQTVGAVARQTTHTYGPGGVRTSTTTPSGQLIEYGYLNGRMTGIKINGVQLLNQILYEPFGPTRGWSWGNGTLAVREYDLDGRPTTVDSALLSTYTYNDDDTIASITDESEPPSSSANPLLTVDVSDTSNRIDSITDLANHPYVYDAAGNTLQDGSRTFIYDDSGRMVQSVSGGVTANYAYNGLGERVFKQTPAGPRYFVYDEEGHLAGVYGASGALIEELVWFEDIPVATIRLTESGGVGFFYVHTDHLNTPMAVTRASDNAVVWRWDRDAYGNGAPEEDADGNALYVNFNLRFPGQYYDEETELIYNYFRDYDPAVGRFLESDQIAVLGSLAAYGYASSDPIDFTDPTGEFVPQLIGAGLGVAIELLTNRCATGWDLAKAAVLGAFGGQFAKAATLRHGARSFTRVHGKVWSHGVGRKLVNKYTSGKLRRYLNRRGGINGSWVHPGRHYLHDKTASGLKKLPKWWPYKKKLPAPLRAVDRIPDWLKVTGAASMRSNSEECCKK